jgi:hypothetical protein
LDSDRLVAITPTLLRRRMSRFTRTTVKFVDGVRDTGSSAACRFSMPTLNLPTFPVSRPPTSMGMTRPALSPMRRV